MADKPANALPVWCVRESRVQIIVHLTRRWGGVKVLGLAAARPHGLPMTLDTENANAQPAVENKSGGIMVHFVFDLLVL